MHSHRPGARTPARGTWCTTESCEGLACRRPCGTSAFLASRVAWLKMASSLPRVSSSKTRACGSD
eukprot:11233814-Alexandrium_andersonii.AAC.1